MKKLLIVIFTFLLINIFIGVYFILKNHKNEEIEIEAKDTIVGVVLPHHNVVAKKRLEFLQLIASKKRNVRKIILIAPDHFSSIFQREISCSDSDWELSNGSLEYDKELGRIICKDYEFRNELVRDDHGIFNILPDIKNVWNESKVVSILIGQKMEFKILDELVGRISNNCGEDCLLIASVDFSHYLPYPLSDIHDRKTERILNNLDEFGINDLEVDSPQSLYILTQIAKKNNGRWNKYFHSNSTKLEGDKNKEGTSHFMGFYETGSELNENIDFTYCVGRFNQDNLTIEELKEKNKDSVGERFFYGVDYLNFSIEEELVLKEQLKFVPGDKTSFDKENNVIGLTKDFVVCGVIGEDPLFLPIDIEEDEKVFLKRGEDKEKYIEEFDIVE